MQRELAALQGALSPASNRPLAIFSQVLITGSDSSLDDISGQQAIVLGRARNRDGTWVYTVRVEGMSETFFVPHAALRATGRALAHADVYDAKASVRVSRAGEGTLVGAEPQR